MEGSVEYRNSIFFSSLIAIGFEVVVNFENEKLGSVLS
jgi:hypothetical protein